MSYPFSFSFSITHSYSMSWIVMVLILSHAKQSSSQDYQNWIAPMVECRFSNEESGVDDDDIDLVVMVKIQGSIM